MKIAQKCILLLEWLLWVMMSFSSPSFVTISSKDALSQLLLLLKKKWKSHWRMRKIFLAARQREKRLLQLRRQWWTHVNVTLFRFTSRIFVSEKSSIFLTRWRRFIYFTSKLGLSIVGTYLFYNKTLHLNSADWKRQ